MSSLSATVTTFNQIYDYNIGSICDNLNMEQISTSSGSISIIDLQNLTNLDIYINTTPPVSSSVYNINVLTTSGSCVFQNNLTINFYYDNKAAGVATVTSGSQNFTVQISTTSSSSTSSNSGLVILGEVAGGIVGAGTLGLAIAKIIPKIRARGYQPLATNLIELSPREYTPITGQKVAEIEKLISSRKFTWDGPRVGEYTTLSVSNIVTNYDSESFWNSNVNWRTQGIGKVVDYLNAYYYNKDDNNRVKQWLFNEANQQDLIKEFNSRNLGGNATQDGVDQLKKIIKSYYSGQAADLKIEGEITAQKIVDELLNSTENVILETVQGFAESKY